MIDGFIVIASLSVLAFGHAGRSTVYPWVLVVVFSALSVVFNVAHAADNLTAQAVAAIPPLALMLAFELFVRQLSPPHPQSTPTSTRPADTDPDTPPTTPELDPATPDVSPALPRPDQTSSVPADPSPRDQARQLYDQHRTTGRALTGAALARALGVSERHGQRLLADLRAEQHPTDPDINPTTGNGQPVHQQEADR